MFLEPFPIPYCHVKITFIVLSVIWELTNYKTNINKGIKVPQICVIKFSPIFSAINILKILVLSV